MNISETVTIVVDVPGAEAGPEVVFDGLRQVLAADSAIRLILTGPEDVIAPFAAQHASRVEAVPTTQLIGMEEHPAAAVRAKKDSSIVVGCKLVKEGRAQGFFSPGSTGAVLAAATLFMGRVKGVSRPALATVIPTAGPPLILTDVGANADCKPEYLVQFAQMASVYARIVIGTENPRIALLNIGSEETKGSQFALETHALLKDRVEGFVGNAEGRDLAKGSFDVVVTDGFTGNVALKVLEGTANSIFVQLKRELFATMRTKIGALIIKPALVSLRDKLDPDTFGGAPLLGVDGVCVIGHGSAGANAIKNGVLVAARAVRGGLTESIAASIAADKERA